MTSWNASTYREWIRDVDDGEERAESALGVSALYARCGFHRRGRDVLPVVIPGLLAGECGSRGRGVGRCGSRSRSHGFQFDVLDRHLFRKM